MLHALRIPVVFLACQMLCIRARAETVPPQLDPELLEHAQRVTDRTELAYEEAPSYYAILDRARHVSPAQLQELAAELLRRHWEQSDRFSRLPLDEFPLFYDLTQNPQSYRGQPITLRGHLVRLVKYDAGPNEFGIDTLYEGWLVTPDAETHPTTVICTEIPRGMPIGEELIDGVSVTGYFFKLHTYSSRDRKIRFAPMVLGHTLNWSPVGAATGWPIDQTAIIIGILVLALLGLLVMVISSRRSAAARQNRFREAVPQTPPDFLNDLTP